MDVGDSVALHDGSGDKLVHDSAARKSADVLAYVLGEDGELGERARQRARGVGEARPCRPPCARGRRAPSSGRAGADEVELGLLAQVARQLARVAAASRPGPRARLPLQVTVPSSETSSVRFALRSAPRALDLEQVGGGRAAAGERTRASSASAPPHTKTSRAPADLAQELRRRDHARERARSRAPVACAAAAHACTSHSSQRGVAQLGERARERLALGSRSRACPASTAGSSSAASAPKPSSTRTALAVRGGGDEQREPRVEALRVAGLEDRGEQPPSCQSRIRARRRDSSRSSSRSISLQHVGREGALARASRAARRARPRSSPPSACPPARRRTAPCSSSSPSTRASSRSSREP